MSDTNQNQESLVQQLLHSRGAGRMALFSDIGGFLMYIIAGLGVIFIGYKALNDIFKTKDMFELEVRFIGDKVKQGDKVQLDPFEQVKELSSEKMFIYSDEVEKLKKNTLTLTLIPINGKQEKLASYYVRNTPQNLLFIYNFQNRK